MDQEPVTISTRRNYAVFFSLYFVQGLPYGLQTRFLPLHFRMGGMTLANITLFKLLMVPWMLKMFFAPLVDHYYSKRFWLNGNLFLLVILCVMASFTPPSSLHYLAIVMFLFNMATAIHDIALDALVIDVLTPSQLAKGNIAQVVGYKFGGLFSGGFFSVLADSLSWEMAFFILALVYASGILISILFLPEEHSTSRTRIEDINASPQERSVIQKIISCYVKQLFNTTGTLWMLLFLFFYKIGEQGVLNMFPMFMLDNGINPNITGFWTGLVGQVFSIVGSILGGLIDYRQLFAHLRFHIVIRGLSLVAIWLGVMMWSSYNTFAYGMSIIALQLMFMAGGALTTITYTLSMQLTKRAPSDCRAKHYTTLTTADVLGRVILPSVMGGLTQWMGYSHIFTCFAITPLLEMIFVKFAPHALKRMED